MRSWLAEDPGRSYQEEEDSILRAAGFDPTEEGWWAKGNVLFNREAALQVAQRELHKLGGRHICKRILGPRRWERACTVRRIFGKYSRLRFATLRRASPGGPERPVRGRGVRVREDTV